MAASQCPAELTRSPPPADSSHITCWSLQASHSRPRARTTFSSNDPFGDWHEDPCSEPVPVQIVSAETAEDNREQS